MATFTPKLNLKRNDGTDPFLRQDFVDNYNKLDAAPGVYVTTSDLLPTWSANQAGRLVFLTDLKQLKFWDGSSFQDERTAVPIYAGAAIFDTAIAKSSAPIYNMVNITVPRPCTLAIWMNMTVSADANKTQYFSLRINFDGADLLMGGYSDAGRMIGDSSQSSGTDQSTTLPALATVTASKGTHSIKAKVSTGTYNTSVTLRGIKTIAAVSLYSASQSL